MKFAPKSVYPKPTKTIVVIFDLRLPGSADRLHRERSVWGEHSDIEALDQHHYVLTVRPGGARELAA